MSFSGSNSALAERQSNLQIIDQLSAPPASAAAAATVRLPPRRRCGGWRGC